MRRYRYDDDGNRDTEADEAGRFGYTGQMRIHGTSLWHYKARAYSPRLGRFLQTDPIGYGDGLNMYAYVGGDAVNRRDPSGLNSAEIGPDDRCDKPANEDIDEICVTGSRPRRRGTRGVSLRGLGNGGALGSGRSLPSADGNVFGGEGEGEGESCNERLASIGNIINEFGLGASQAGGAMMVGGGGLLLASPFTGGATAGAGGGLLVFGSRVSFIGGGMQVFGSALQAVSGARGVWIT
ncbi:RHS repeat-associated core domain-containing protein [Parvularcula maris]|uniref:RHS repeat-associated core domain-containing protein n=1 Tax=Parvularcula maris TaxID=2965077 RepID=UPI00351A299E